MSAMERAVLAVHRGGATRRFHTLDTIATNTVASHSFGVAWLATLISGTPSANLLLYCLRHDLAEYALGDVPAPVKRSLGISEGFDALEEKYLQDQAVPSVELTAEEFRIFKLADNLDGLRFCIAEMNRGNRSLDECARNYTAYIEAMNPHGRELDVFFAVQNLNVSGDKR